MKQDALYVRLARDGGVVSPPLQVDKSASDKEYERAGNYRRFVTSLLKEGRYSPTEYAKVKEFIAALFARRNASAA